MKNYEKILLEVALKIRKDILTDKGTIEDSSREIIEAAAETTLEMVHEAFKQAEAAFEENENEPEDEDEDEDEETLARLVSTFISIIKLKDEPTDIY